MVPATKGKDHRASPLPADVLNGSCPSRLALDRIAGKWTALIVYALADGRRRHGELRRTVQGISQKMLTQTLRTMERDGLVSREVHDQVPPHVEYALTPLGRSVKEPLVALCIWTMEHSDEIQAANERAALHARTRDSGAAGVAMGPQSGSARDRHS